jgi:hypothetical protein
MSAAFNKGIIRRYNTFTYSSSDVFNLTMEQSGSVIFIVTTGNHITFKLPTATDNAGGNFKFIATTAGNNLIFNSATANIITLNVAAATTKTISTMVLGECIECITDGTNWYVIENN